MTHSHSFGFTQEEARYLGRKPARTGYGYGWYLLLFVLLVSIIHFLIEPQIFVPEAHAAEVLKTNADYCHEWQQGMWNVVGATEAQMSSLCGEYLTK